MDEDGACRILHRGECRAGELVGVDDDADAMCRELRLRDRVVGGWDGDDGDVGVACVEGVAERDDLIGRFGARVDHDGVCACRDIRLGACEGILLSLFEDQALDARDDHKLLRALCRFARRNLFGEIFDRVLRLRDLRAKEGVALCARLVLDDDGGDADTLEGADVVGKVLCRSARVHVEDDGLRRDVHDLVDGLDAVGEVDELDVGLAA